MEQIRNNPLRLAAIGAPAHAFLPCNTLIGSHLVDEFLSHDGIVATYAGHHLHSGDPVLIREYFPSDIAARADGHFVVPTSIGASDALADGLGRFNECAQRLRRVGSAHLAPVVDVIHANDTAYLVSGALDGETLDRWLARAAPLADMQVVEVAIQALIAIEGLSAQGLCHREIREDQLAVLHGGEVMLLHTETLLHGVHPAFATLPIARAVAAADLSALAALLTRLCHAAAAEPRAATTTLVRERSPMLMMLIERALPGSRELDGLDAARWRRSFERLRGQLAADAGAAISGMLPPPRQPPAASVAGSPVTTDVLALPVPEPLPPAAPPTGGSVADRAISLVEVGLIPVLLTAAWFLVPHAGDGTAHPAAGGGQSTAVAAPTPEAPSAALTPGTESAAPIPVATPAERPTPLPRAGGASAGFGNALPSTAFSNAPRRVEPEPPSPATTMGPSPAAGPDAGDGTVAELLAAAAADLAARRMTVPAGDNALEKFRAVLRLDRNNAEARQGLRQIADGLAARASRSLSAGNEVETEALLRRARSADPGNARIAAVEQALTARRQAAAPTRIAEPYPPRFEAAAPPPPAPPPVEPDEAASRAEEIRQRFGGR